MYTAVVLDEKSHLKLVKWADDNIKVNGVRLPILVRDNGWEMICHHMTINMGKALPQIEAYLGTKQKLDITHYGISDKAIAVRVVGFYVDPGEINRKPHITVAVNRRDGGKPVDSNKITNWIPVDGLVTLSGEVK
jgi:hypothetical protein